jgi:hypothetical protein
MAYFPATFRNRASAVKKLVRVDVYLDLHPTGKENKWNGDPALIFSHPLTVRHGGNPVTVIGACFFTSTSKMGCGSFSLPAAPPSYGGSCPASALKTGRPDEKICGKCYAIKGNFQYELPQLYQAARFRWIRDQLVAHTTDQISTVLANAVKTYNGNGKARRAAGENGDFFRIHDSGDLWDPRYWEIWQGAIRKCQPIRFWAPTRMHFLPKWAALFARGHSSYLALRPSSYHFNDPGPLAEGMDAGTTSHYDGTDPVTTGMADFSCTAYAAGGSCADSIDLAYRIETPEMKRMIALYRSTLSPAEKELTRNGRDCRVCWLRKDWRVSYKAH